MEKNQWRVSDKKTSITKNHTGFGKNGLQSELFERTVDGETEYVYAFAGTNSFEDVLEDIAQLVGAAPQYSVAIDNARTLSDELGNAELTFVGHSLGGGEAAAASMATNKKAITFNRASVSKATQALNGLGSTRNVKNFITKSLDSDGSYVLEPVSRAQNTKMFGISVMPSNGRTEYIKINRRLSLLEAHGIKTVIQNIYR